MTSRKYIAFTLNITEQYLSMILTGKRKVSWEVASRLTEIFPGKTIQQWEKLEPEELKRACILLSIDTIKACPSLVNRVQIEDRKINNK